MRIKTWLKVFFLLFFTSILLVGSINYFIDPLVNFNHSNSLNYMFKEFDERQQKTNYINNTDKQFNGILVGSSRSTYISQNDFINMNIFNYGLSGMWPYEYKPYIDFFKSKQKRELDYIIIGADFYGSQKKPPEVIIQDPSIAINRTLQDTYKYKTLLSIDNFRYSWSTIKMNLSSKFFRQYNSKFLRQYFDRNMIKGYKKVSMERLKHRFRLKIVLHNQQFEKYTWNDKYFINLKNLISENPKTKFIIFTPPISADLFVSIMKNHNKFNEYSRWIRGLVDTFGEVYCFMDINSITTNLENYPDDDHFYPYIGKILANKISTDNFESEPKDFGVKVNKNNVEDFLKKQLEKINSYEYSEFYPKEEMDDKLKLNEDKYKML